MFAGMNKEVKGIGIHRFIDCQKLTKMNLRNPSITRSIYYFFEKVALTGHGKNK